MSRYTHISQGQKSQAVENLANDLAPKLGQLWIVMDFNGQPTPLALSETPLLTRPP